MTGHLFRRMHGNRYRGPHPPWRVGAFFILLPVHALCPVEFCHLMVEAVIVIRRCAVQYWAHWCEHHCVHDTRCNSWTTSQQAYFLPESRVYLP